MHRVMQQIELRYQRSSFFYDARKLELKIRIRCSASQKMTISMLRHPFRAAQMAIERMFCTIGFKLWVDVEYQLRHLAPVCPLLVGIEQSQICYYVLLVVHREDRIRRCYVGHVRI
jgi:hypothetical protein